MPSICLLRGFLIGSDGYTSDIGYDAGAAVDGAAVCPECWAILTQHSCPVAFEVAKGVRSHKLHNPSLDR